MTEPELHSNGTYVISWIGPVVTAITPASAVNANEQENP